MAKSPTTLDVLVLGDHPCTYFAAAVLKATQSALRVLHVALPDEAYEDRLVLINPGFFELHGSLEPLKRQWDLVPIHGLKFLSDNSDVKSAHASKSIAGYVGSFKQVRVSLIKLADHAKVEFEKPADFQIHHLDEAGVELSLDAKRFHPKLLIVGCELSAAHKKQLGVPETWETGVLHRYTYLKLKGTKWSGPAQNSLMPMSLDLRGQLLWGWMLAGKGSVQLAVDQLGDSANGDGLALLRHWADVLLQHGELKTLNGMDFDRAVGIDLPLSGALVHETVANRTLLIGPAGGFLTACAEDIYPTCWSALFAVEVARKALKEQHVQDALQPFRHKWGATLGDFLRGPQQNLRFLMPLVYRNPMMTMRLTEAILSGKSVVR